MSGLPVGPPPTTLYVKVCAWCPGEAEYHRERVPWNGEAVTVSHGICARHEQEMMRECEGIEVARTSGEG